jgi:malonyl CoA-acyl carrier protein transacylase
MFQEKVMKKIIIAVASLAMLFAVTGSVMAADKATAYCEKMAKKHHVTEDKMESYMKSCVDKHHKSHKKVAAKSAAKPAAAPAATAPAAESPAAQ